MIAILLHGGAGDWPEKQLFPAKKILEKAASKGLSLLQKNKKSIDVVEKCINILEDSGIFNAGSGCAKQRDGRARADACIMGEDLRCGCVAALEGIKNPISVARAVMEKTGHILLVGKFAKDFALKNHFEKIRTKNSAQKNEETVGCLALDSFGNLSAGNSTGGLKNAIPGRVGDSALIGAGIYANEFAAAVTTGTGEAFIKTSLARIACVMIENGIKPQYAAEKCVKIISEKTGKKGGIIILDRKGNHGTSHNSKNMPWVCKSTKAFS